MDPKKCSAMKKSGKQCTNNIKKNGTCGIESHIAQKLKNEGFKKPNSQGYIPLKISRLAPEAANTASVVKDINLRLERGPSKSDKAGYIYMYKLKNGDSSSLYRKVGRTERLPEIRMKEWPSGVLVKSWACKRNRMAEYLIHKYLDYCRIERLAMEIDTKGNKSYMSIWWSSGEFVADGNYSKYIDMLGKHEEKQVDVAYELAKKKDIEWFKEQERIIKDVVRIVVSDINSHYSHEPWISWMPEVNM